MSALKLLKSTATKIEQKKGEPRLVFDMDTLAVARGLLSAKSEYAFRLWVVGTYSIASNVVAAATILSPLGTSEWSSIAALFDEYRVDEVINHLCPTLVAGNTGANWANGGYAVCNDYNDSTAPSTYVEVLEHAESHIEPISQCFIVGSTSTNATSAISVKLMWRAVPPRFVELASAATVAQAEWLETAVAWPGSIKFIAAVNGTNSDTPMSRYTEYRVRCRQRR
jgi:hypothetical protein